MKSVVKLLYALLVVGVMGCMSIDDLQDQNGVLRFEVQHLLSRDVVLGDVQILNDSSLVRIPLLYGKESFPISLSCVMQLSPGARMLGLNPAEVLFEEGNTMLTFYIVAANGATRMWHLQLQMPDGAAVSNLLDFKVKDYSPNSAFVFEQGEIRVLDTTLFIVVPESSFPLSVTPEVTLAEGCTLLDEQSVYRFESYATTHRLLVQSSDGVITQWQLALKQPPLMRSHEGVARAVWQAVSLSDGQFSLMSEQVFRQIIDSERNGLWCLVSDSLGEQQPKLEGMVQMQLPSYVWHVGWESGEHLELLLNDVGRRCYLYDQVRGNCKRWELRYVNSSYYYGGFEHFVPTQNSPAEIELLSDSVLIDNEGGVVWIPYRGPESSFPLTMKVNHRAVADASVQGLSVGQSLVFRNSGSTYSFKMKSGAGIERNWQLRLLGAGENNKLAGVTQLEVIQMQSLAGKLKVNSFAEVDAQQQQIRLIVEDWSDDLPVTIQCKPYLMPGARLVSGGWDGVSTLTFNDYSASYTLQTESQDGSVQQTYTIVLENRAKVRSHEAEVRQFMVSHLAPGYGVSAIQIDNSAKKVVIELSSMGSGVFYFTPQWQLSAGATLDGLQAGVPFLFGSLSRHCYFTVTSEDEQVQHQWQLVVDASPQLENWQLDLWSDQYTAVGWASANSTFGRNMQRASRDGGYCAQLTTSTILGNVAAGSLFMGHFQIDLSQLDNTRMMTYMGIPFVGRPTAMQVDLNYDANGGNDMGSCTIELLNYVGSNFEYHSIGNEAGVTVLARGEHQTGSTNGWQTVTVPLSTLNSTLSVTHIHVIFSSSYRGDDLVGTVGATLWVDNVRLVY